MYLGLNISHDASAAILNKKGQILSAISEERISRIKNHIGIPSQSIQALLKTNRSIDLVVIGTYEKMNVHDLYRFLASMRGNPSNTPGRWADPYPGFLNSNKLLQNPNLYIEAELVKIFKFLDVDYPGIAWINHHDAHLGCAFGITENKRSLLISLDGEGDGESGAISISNNNKLRSLARFSSLDSLGNLYSAVTKRYNFKPGHHEGKITGLAALGSYSSAVDILLRHIEVNHGVPKIVKCGKFKSLLLRHTFHRSGLRHSSVNSLDQIVALAEANTSNYADLAFAVQEVLETSVKEIINFWVQRTGVSDLALAGGVFANVKLNQKIAELETVNTVRIFPNMGDGGLSVGGVWALMAQQGIQISSKPFENMYLAPSTQETDQEYLDSILQDSLFQIEVLSKQGWHDLCAIDVADGKLVALHQGKMEFGPRALGNRTLLFDPRDATAKVKINSRLRRTEFMPFAPICTVESAYKFFDLPKDLSPLYYMTMTCRVKHEWKSRLPAVTHIDGTARPQLVSIDSNRDVHLILIAFENICGLPIMVNTSLNIHEEPINASYKDSIKALTLDAFDVIYFGNIRVSLRKQR